MVTTDVPSQLTKVDWTNDLDTPHFRLLEKTEDYELKEYEATKWVMSDMSQDGEWEGSKTRNTTFYKLFRYITGNNAASAKIPMTSPVRSEHRGSYVDMAFMVPHHVTENTPTPNREDVQVIEQDKQAVYVRTFSGWGYGFFGNKNYFEENLKELKAALDRDGKSYDNERFYTAQYDSPFKLFNRHNEVWVSKI